MKKGFTLVELILVITILGILAVALLPQFFEFTTETEIAARDDVVGSVRTGIALIRAEDLATNGPPGNYPTVLDSVPDNTDCTATNRCFGNVLSPNGIADDSWHKVDSTSYTFNDGTTTYTFTYDNINGTFLSPTAP